jgi:hypothetical protein
LSRNLQASASPHWPSWGCSSVAGEPAGWHNHVPLRASAAAVGYGGRRWSVAGRFALVGRAASSAVACTLQAASFPRHAPSQSRRAGTSWWPHLPPIAPRGNAVRRFDATRLANTWLFAPRKCARSRSERPRAAKTDPRNPERRHPRGHVPCVSPCQNRHLAGK